MAISKITVDVDVIPTVETAERCLKILEWYLNDRSDTEIICRKKKTEVGVMWELQLVNNLEVRGEANDRERP